MELRRRGSCFRDLKETFRKDYAPSDYTIPDIDMFLDLAAAKTTVTTKQTVVPQCWC